MELTRSHASSVYDVIVVGIGGAGSATAAELAARGATVLGLEQHGIAHNLGSSHGGTRLIRQAYFEDPTYVPLLLRAYERWHQLELATNSRLLTQTGGLMIGPRTSRTVAGSVASAEQWGLDYELLDSAEVARRWPMFTPSSNDVALHETRAGFVRPEATVAAQVALAIDRGAELYFHEAVTGWRTIAGGVEVATRSQRFRGARLVLAPGAWAPDLLSALGLPLVVERHVQFWLRAKHSITQFSPQRHPVYIWEDSGGTQVYGFPAVGSAEEGVKASFFRRGTPAQPDTLYRLVDPDEVRPLRRFLKGRVPALGPEVCHAEPCMYTTSPDQHFVLGLADKDERVVICSACSGHGFKFVPVIGEIVADLVTLGGTDFDISLFDPGRFAGADSLHAQSQEGE
jgi:sarcosine oxidase